MHLRPPTKSLKAGFSVRDSARALIIRFPIAGSLAQDGIKPQCMSLQWLPLSSRKMTGMFGEVSGATLKRGVYLGRSRSQVPANPYVTELKRSGDAATHDGSTYSYAAKATSIARSNNACANCVTFVPACQPCT
jgi:hypothetical protein